jgi:hypothetical protein
LAASPSFQANSGNANIIIRAIIRAIENARVLNIGREGL